MKFTHCEVISLKSSEIVISCHTVQLKVTFWGGKTLFLCSIRRSLCMCLICIVRSAAVRKVVNAFS